MLSLLFTLFRLKASNISLEYLILPSIGCFYLQEISLKNPLCLLNLCCSLLWCVDGAAPCSASWRCCTVQRQLTVLHRSAPVDGAAPCSASWRCCTVQRQLTVLHRSAPVDGAAPFSASWRCCTVQRQLTVLHRAAPVDGAAPCSACWRSHFHSNRRKCNANCFLQKKIAVCFMQATRIFLFNTRFEFNSAEMHRLFASKAVPVTVQSYYS